MVVPVLMTNCQVSLNLNIGPVTAQTAMIPAARMKAIGFPVARAAALAKRLNQEVRVILPPESEDGAQLRASPRPHLPYCLDLLSADPARKAMCEAGFAALSAFS